MVLQEIGYLSITSQYNFMKRLIVLLFTMLVYVCVNAQTVKGFKSADGYNAGGTNISNLELKTLDGINTSKTIQGQFTEKANVADAVKLSTYYGVDSLVYDGTRKRWRYLAPDHFWRTIAIQDSSFVTNVTGLLTGITGAWEFDETSGTDAVPAVGTLHGTAQGGVTVNQTGKIGKCWVLDNTNGYIEFADNAINDLTNNFTISIWFKAANYSTNRYIFTKGAGMYAARVNSTGPQFRWMTTGLTPSAANAATFTPVADQWTLLCLTYVNGVGAKVYWNGVYKETLAMSGTITTDNFSLKIGRYTGTEVFNGSIDQFIIWGSRVLTDSDITTLYNSGNGRPISQM